MINDAIVAAGAIVAAVPMITVGHRFRRALPATEA